MRIKLLKRTLTFAFLASTLVACGGGSSGNGGDTGGDPGSTPPDTTAPTGYAITNLTDPIDASNVSSFSFDVTGAERGASFSYEIFGVNSSTVPVIQDNGSVANNSFSVSGIDLSDAPDGAIIVEFVLEDDAGNRGDTVTASATKLTVTSGDDVTISGGITFDLVPLNTFTSGLDYDAITQSPARRVLIQALDASDNVLVSTVTDDSGNYSLNVPENSLVKIRAQARLLRAGTYDVSIRDNTSGDALYVLDGSLANSGSVDSVRTLHAPSGWDGNDYSSTRSAGPFAILDTLYTASEKFVAIDAGINFPALDIFWSENNSVASGNLADGDIGTSFYNGTAIYLLGAEDSDTDEYDRHVVAHEWGHYFEDKVSRADSIGGAHGIADRLDFRVAMSEGFGNALSAIVWDDSFYRDSSGNDQSSGFFIDMERNIQTNEGWFNEGSVQSIIYDIYDSDDDGPDVLSLGLEPLYNALTANTFVSSDFLLSIYDFLDAMKAEASSSSSVIDNLANAQSIDGTGNDGSGETNDGGIPQVLPLYKSLTIGGPAVEVCSTNQAGRFNKLGVRAFIEFTVPATTSYDILAQRISGPTNRDVDFIVRNQGDIELLAQSFDSDEESATGVLTAGAKVLEVYDFAYLENNFPVTTTCFDVTVN